MAAVEFPMLDISLLRKDLPAVIAALEARQSPQPFLDVARFGALEAERKANQSRTEELQARRNALSRQIGQAKAKGEDSSAAMTEVASLADELKASAARLDELKNQWGWGGFTTHDLHRCQLSARRVTLIYNG